MPSRRAGLATLMMVRQCRARSGNVDLMLPTSRTEINGLHKTKGASAPCCYLSSSEPK